MFIPSSISGHEISNQDKKKLPLLLHYPQNSSFAPTEKNPRNTNTASQEPKFKRFTLDPVKALRSALGTCTKCAAVRSVGRGRKTKTKCCSSKGAGLKRGYQGMAGLRSQRSESSLCTVCKCLPRNKSFCFLSCLRTQVSQTRQFKLMELLLQQ